MHWFTCCCVTVAFRFFMEFSAKENKKFRAEKQTPQHFYPLPVWSFMIIQQNPPATQHFSVVQHTDKN